MSHYAIPKDDGDRRLEDDALFDVGATGHNEPVRDVDAPGATCIGNFLYVSLFPKAWLCVRDSFRVRDLP